MKKIGLKEKNLDYYEMFLNNAKIMIDIVKILDKLVENYDKENISEIVKKVHKLENDADKNVHEVLNYLIRDFLPPIDREDIVLLVNRMDDSIDYLDEIVINLNILNVDNLKNEFSSFIKIIDTISNLLVSMLNSFKDKKSYKTVHELIIEINETEEKGDKIFEEAITNLFKNEKDSIEVIKWN
ncbi:MAG: DUF47 family protein, partial [Clostridia bacterium]|nr:DUF47 family protein [Clostridia bacterium]